MAVFISPFKKMIWPQPFERFHTQKSNKTATIIVLRAVWGAKREISTWIMHLQKLKIRNQNYRRIFFNKKLNMDCCVNLPCRQLSEIKT